MTGKQVIVKNCLYCVMLIMLFAGCGKDNIVVSSGGGNPDPTEEWQTTYGGQRAERLYDLHSTSDDGYILTGYTRSNIDSDKDIYLLKTNNVGDELWHSYHGANNDDEGIGVLPLSGSYVVVGNTCSLDAVNSDIWLGVISEMDGQGILTANYSYGATLIDSAFCVLAGLNGEIIIGCTLYDNVASLIAAGIDGQTFWQTEYQDCQLTCVEKTPDFGYIIAGATNQLDVPADVVLIKTDSDGNSIWSRQYGGEGDDRALSVKSTTDNGFIVAGATGSFSQDGNPGDTDIYLFKVNADGDLEWEHNLGGDLSDIGKDIIQTTDGGFLIVGKTQSYAESADDYNGYVIKTDENGDITWQRSIGGNGNDELNCVLQTDGGGYIAAGASRSGYTDWQGWMIFLLPEPPE